MTKVPVWTDVGAVDDIPRLGARVVSTPVCKIAVFRTEADEVFALEDKCPHKGGPLSQGIVHGKSVTCPLHNWAIDLECGEAKAPDKGCARPIPVRVEGGRVRLDLGPFEAVKTTCPYCGVGCGVQISPNGTVQGDPDHPANAGRLCSKGAALGEWLNPAERLMRPRVAARDASWDGALDLVARRFAETIAEHGPDSVAFYVSGQMLTEDYYVANKLMKGFIGSANIDTNSRLCMASSVAGHIRAFGEDVVPGIYADWDEADLIVLVGSNAAWCHPILFQRIEAAKAKRGTRVVTIDPRRTATSEIADLHLSIAAGSDVALFSGLLSYLADSGALDRRYIDAHTNEYGAALAQARSDAGSIEQVAAVTGVTAGNIETFFDWFSATERTVTVYSQGVNQSSAGTDKVNAIINCHLATGRIGRPGMGPFSVTGQPNAMGGREVGGLANQLAAHMGFDDPNDIDRVRRFWHAPRIAARPGLKAIDMFDAVRDGRIKAIWIMATNPADSMPSASKVREALTACPFVIVSDCWETDTTRLAHVVLPAAAWGEKDGTVTNSERVISRQRAFHAAPGEARPDWRIVSDVASRMGWGEWFSYDHPVDIFREHAALSSFENNGRRAFDIGALAFLSNAAYDEMSPARWPVPMDGLPGTARMFGDGRYKTADGRACFLAAPWRSPASQTSPTFPLVLNTGRLRDQWHTMTRTGRSPRLMAHRSEPCAEIGPRLAEMIGIAAGDLVRLTTPHGTTVLPTLIDERQPPNTVFVPMHWTDQYSSAGPIDRLVGAACDPVSGQPELKFTPARLTRAPAHWRGILMRRSAEAPAHPCYWHRIPMPGGNIFELAGLSVLPNGGELAKMVKELLDGPAGAPIIDGSDTGQGSLRFATGSTGSIDACLFLSQSAAGDLPQRDTLAALIGSPLLDARKLAAIGRMPVLGTARTTSQTICSCYSINLDTIHRAIAKDGLATVTEIGAALRAGTNCGSCIPELKEILREAAVV